MLRHYAAGEWGALVIATISTIAVAIAYLARPLPLALAVDHLLDKPVPFDLTGSDWRLLIGLAFLVLVVALLNALGSHIADGRLEDASERIAHRLRVDTYSRLQRLSLAFHERSQTGDLVARITGDVGAVGSLFEDSLGNLASAGILLLGMFLVSLVIDPLVAVTAFAAAPALALVAFRFQPRIKALARQRRALAGEIASLSEESLSSIRAVKALGAGEFEEERLREKSKELQDITRESSQLEGRYSISIDVLGAVALALVVIVGVLRAAAGAVSIGELIVMYTYARRIDRPLRTLARTAAKTSNSLARAERIAEILSVDEFVEDRPDAFRSGRARGEIELRDVYFEYEPGRPALAGVSIQIPAGTKVALVGRSGAGKSTLAALIARLYDPTSGQVLLDGRDLHDCAVAWLRDQFGLVLQEAILFTGTVAENIAYGGDAPTLEEIVAAARAVGAHAFIRELPDGYETQLGPRGVALSGGQRQRIAIARTLLRDPPMLLLDEPTTGLDPRSETEVLAAVETLMEGRTTIIISHSPALVDDADRVIALDAGRVVETRELERGTDDRSARPHAVRVVGDPGSSQPPHSASPSTARRLLRRLTGGIRGR